MKEDYAVALPRILTSEGDKVDNKLDPGGRTNRGITQRVFTAWLRNQGKPSRDVYTITDEEVAAIYRVQYADKIDFDQLPAGVDYAMFDAAVNSGPAQAVKWLQRALGITVDGVIGQATLAAVAADNDNDALVAAICKQRLNFLKHLKTWKTFGKGWGARVAMVQKLGQQMAAGAVAEPTTFFAGGENKASLSDAVQAPRTATASAVASGGTVSAGVTQVLNTIQPLQGLIPHIGDAVTVITALSGLVAIGGGAWLWWAKQRAAERDDALDLKTAAPVAAQPAAAAA